MSPSRSSQASWTPVLAPLGTAARADRAVVERHVDLDGRIAAAIENLPSVNVNNHAHGERNLSYAWDRVELPSTVILSGSGWLSSGVELVAVLGRQC